MKTISLDSLAHVTGGGLSAQELQNMLIDPIRMVGPLMAKHPGLPVAKKVIEQVIRPR